MKWITHLQLPAQLKRWVNRIKLSDWIKEVRDNRAVRSIGKWPCWEKYSIWEWLLLGVGVLSLFFILLNVFSTLGDPTPDPQSQSLITLADMPAFEATIASLINSEVENGSPIAILTDGEAFIADLLSEMDRAERSIYITNYIWDDGQFGTMLFAELTKHAERGIEVKVLLDGMGGSGASDDQIETLAESGGTVAYFRPIKWWNLNRIDRRSHVRDFVIDGKVGYLGGLAISDEWLGNADQPNLWHDYMFKVEGEMTARLENVFATIWAQTTGEIVAPRAPQALEVSEAHTGSSTHFISLLSSPSPDLSAHMEYFIWASIMAAEKSVLIETPYLLPNKSILEALVTKAREGVEVMIIVPGENTDTKHTRWASESYYKELLEAGVQLYEYQPSRFHPKIMILDDIWSIIGSANLDNRSRKINLEFNLGVTDTLFAKDLRAKFDIDLSNSKQITIEEIRKRTWLYMPFRLLSSVFIHQY